MSSFEVSATSLQEASAVLSSPEAVSLGSGGAAAGTPVEQAWSGFVSAADRMSRDSHVAVGDLSRALGLAARAYRWADDSAARSFGGGG